MKHDQLWAPWRLAYVTGDDKSNDSPAAAGATSWEPGAEPSCFLCRGVAEFGKEVERRNLVVARTEKSVVVLNRYPYNNGHLLVAPRLHKPDLSQLTPQEHLDLMQLLTKLCDKLQQLMKPEGFNIGLNLGRVAGAGLPGHLHWHIVPRWNGDTNFMPTLAGVRVIPQSLDALWEILQDALSS